MTIPIEEINNNLNLVLGSMRTEYDIARAKMIAIEQEKDRYEHAIINDKIIKFQNNSATINDDFFGVFSSRTNFIISPGGSGSRYLKRIFETEDLEYCLSGFGQGHGAHIKNPEQLFNYYRDNQKVLYLCEDPVEMLVHHYNHGFFQSTEHCINTGGPVDEMIKFSINYPYFYQKENLETFTINEFFTSYIENGVDFFCLETHINNWLTSTKFDIFACQYKEIPIRWHEITKFMDPKEPKTLNWKPRVATRSHLNESTVTALQEMYSRSIKLYNSMAV